MFFNDYYFDNSNHLYKAFFKLKALHIFVQKLSRYKKITYLFNLYIVAFKDAIFFIFRNSFYFQKFAYSGIFNFSFQKLIYLKKSGRIIHKDLYFNRCILTPKYVYFIYCI